MTVVVLGQRASFFAELLGDRDVDAVVVEHPTEAALRDAEVVLLAEPHGVPLADAAWDVLDAGALLVAPRAEPAYGLEPGIDHLSAGTDGELADLVALAVTFPRAFDPVVAMGRLMAQARPGRHS
jgi:hypothetical protein